MGAAALLNPQKFDRYVRMLQNRTVILPEARYMKMESDVVDIDRIGFGGRILRAAATEGEALAENQWATPTTDQQKLTAVENQAIVSLTDKVLRRNIEKANFENTLLDMIGERAGLDLEELGIQGDTDSADTFLATNDGWLKLAGRVVQEVTQDDITGGFVTGAAQTTHTLDLGQEGVPITPSTWTLNSDAPQLVAHDDGNGLIVQDNASGITGTIDYDSGDITLAGLATSETYDYDYDAKAFDWDGTKFPEDMFQLMLEVVPKPYFQRRGEWRLYVPWWVEDAYRDLLKGRGTQLGDDAQTGAKALMYKGVPVVEVPSMPQWRATLQHPDNMAYGVFHEVQLEPEREAKAHRTDFCVNMETDFGYENPEAGITAKIKP